MVASECHLLLSSIVQTGEGLANRSDSHVFVPSSAISVSRTLARISS
jgi:hypothetical protein